MLKRASILFFLIVNIVTAQIPNNSFEHWTGVNPDDWQTANIPIVPQSIMPDTEAYQGSTSVKGMVVGQNNNMPYAPYLAASGAFGFSIGQPFNLLEGWCKINIQPGDRFRVVVHVWDDQQEPVGEGILVVDSSTTSWMHFGVNINYTTNGSNLNCAIYFTITDSTGVASGHIGSYFLVDDLSMIRSVINVKEVFSEDQISVYPNPVSDFLNIQTINKSMFSYSLYDLNGKLLSERPIESLQEKISLSHFPNGQYLLKVICEDGVITKRIVVSN